MRCVTSQPRDAYDTRFHASMGNSHQTVVKQWSVPACIRRTTFVQENKSMQQRGYAFVSHLPLLFPVRLLLSRGETIAAEDIMHDMGAISVMSSDSQAMGRVGEVITRTWQTADKVRKYLDKSRRKFRKYLRGVTRREEIDA